MSNLILALLLVAAATAAPGNYGYGGVSRPAVLTRLMPVVLQEEYDFSAENKELKGLEADGDGDGGGDDGGDGGGDGGGDVGGDDGGDGGGDGGGDVGGDDGGDGGGDGGEDGGGDDEGDGGGDGSEDGGGDGGDGGEDGGKDGGDGGDGGDGADDSGDGGDGGDNKGEGKEIKFEVEETEEAKSESEGLSKSSDGEEESELKLKFGSCGEGEIRRIDGECVIPNINRHTYLFQAPRFAFKKPKPAKIPNPEVDLSMVFVRVPSASIDNDPVVIPPPQQKTAVYLLRQHQPVTSPKVVEVPFETPDPDVYFINYNDGDNLPLPGGIDLDTALKSSLLQGTVIGDGSGELEATFRTVSGGDEGQVSEAGGGDGGDDGTGEGGKEDAEIRIADDGSDAEAGGEALEVAAIGIEGAASDGEGAGAEGDGIQEAEAEGTEADAETDGEAELRDGGGGEGKSGVENEGGGDGDGGEGKTEDTADGNGSGGDEGDGGGEGGEGEGDGGDEGGDGGDGGDEKGGEGGDGGDGGGESEDAEGEGNGEEDEGEKEKEEEGNEGEGEDEGDSGQGKSLLSGSRMSTEVIKGSPLFMSKKSKSGKSKEVSTVRDSGEPADIIRVAPASFGQSANTPGIIGSTIPRLVGGPLTTTFRGSPTVTGFGGGSSVIGFGGGSSVSGFGGGSSVTGFGGGSSVTGFGGGSSVAGFGGGSSVTGFGGGSSVAGFGGGSSVAGFGAGSSATGFGGGPSVNGFGEALAVNGFGGESSINGFGGDSSLVGIGGKSTGVGGGTTITRLGGGTTVTKLGGGGLGAALSQLGISALPLAEHSGGSTVRLIQPTSFRGQTFTSDKVRVTPKQPSFQNFLQLAPSGGKTSSRFFSRDFSGEFGKSIGGAQQLGHDQLGIRISGNIGKSLSSASASLSSFNPRAPQSFSALGQNSGRSLDASNVFVRESLSPRRPAESIRASDLTARAKPAKFLGSTTLVDKPENIASPLAAPEQKQRISVPVIPTQNNFDPRSLQSNTLAFSSRRPPSQSSTSSQRVRSKSSSSRLSSGSSRFIQASGKTGQLTKSKSSRSFGKSFDDSPRFLVIPTKKSRRQKTKFRARV